MQSLLSMHEYHTRAVSRVLRRNGDILLRDSLFSNQPQAVMAVTIAQNRGFVDAYERGRQFHEAPDDEHIVVRLKICSGETIQACEEGSEDGGDTEPDGELTEDRQWLQFNNYGGDLSNMISCGIELVYRPGTMTWSLVLKRTDLDNATVSLPDSACLVFEQSQTPADLTETVFKGKITIFSFIDLFNHPSVLTGVHFQAER